MKEVLLIFKTHLDCGYTDLAEKVTEHYLKHFIPQAIDLAKSTQNTDTPFVWNTGSWLLNEALKHDTDGVVDNAIKQGLICWHALPFTTHTELMNSQLLEYGLSIGKRLDERYGKTTVSAKMTDVPGHTIGLVSHLAKNGIKFLHIGVNPATPVPNVPKMFRWKCDNDEIAVIVNGGGYGGTIELGDTAVEFYITNDNCGPQNIDDVQNIYKQMRQKYPNAYIHAGSLDDVANLIDISSLPVVTQEIGDTWIHGCGTDPLKVAKYRSVLRQIADKDLSRYDITDNLLLVPEHTCGLCVQKYFGEETQYYPQDLSKITNQPRTKYIVKSWQEQRNYVDESAKLFGIDLQSEFDVKQFDLDGFVKVPTVEPCVRLQYQLFDNDDFARYKEQYLQTDILWAIYDYTKVWLPVYQGGVFTARSVATWQKDNQFVYQLAFDKDITTKCGLPSVFVYQCENNVELRWFGKKANRLPEAYWLKFTDVKDGDWQLHKLGRWIDANNVAGSPFIHAIDSGVKTATTQITSLDAVLVAPFGKKLLHYGEPTEKQDLYFNLYNNIWNTNFPLWFSDDMRYRFVLDKVEQGRKQDRFV